MAGLVMAIRVALALALAFSVSVANVAAASAGSTLTQANETAPEVHHFTIAHWDFSRVQTPLSVSIWLFVVALARIGFHQHATLPSMFPESCLLIILGVLAGLAVYFVGGTSVPLNPDTFFLFLLPPIVLEAGFFMNIRALFDNLGTVAWYAVVGTIFNSVTIGFSLYTFSASVLGWMTIPMTMLDAMLFASLIAAVDPVAVLAVFQEIHVNEELYVLVFGESLFNDAVSVVLFNVFYKLSFLRQHGEIWVSDWIQAAVSLFIVGIVGAVIGMLFAFSTAFITKYTTPIRVLEPLFAFLMAYFAYITAELFHFSGILAAVFCGMFMKPYIQSNMSTKSYTTVKYFLKMLSSVCESIVFMLMGLATVDSKHEVDVVFIGLTLLFCLVYRTLGVVVLTWIINRFRTIKLGKVDQFVMAYGGLRGAIAMSLALLISAETTKINGYFVTCTIVIVYFTVFVQGITIRPLVNWLKVKKKSKNELSINAQLHLRVMDYMMAAVEDLVGVRGHNLLRSKIERVNMKYLEPVLLRHDTQTREQGLMHVISKLNMKEAMDFVSAHGSVQTFQRQASQRTLGVAASATATATGANGGARPSPRPLENVDSGAERGRNVVNKWRRAVERLAASNIATSTNDDTHKILKENLFKKPKYYRGQYLTTKLQLNESFPRKLLNLEETESDILQSVVADGPTVKPRNFHTKDRLYAQARQDPFANTRFRKHRSRPDRRYKTAHDTNNTPEENPSCQDRKMSLQSESGVPYMSNDGGLHDPYAFETPKGSVVSLPTVSTRYTSPEPVFATSSSSVISFRAAPPSLGYSDDHQYGNLTSVHSQSPLTSSATANLNRRAVREVIYENAANVARRSLSHELQSPRESSL